MATSIQILLGVLNWFHLIATVTWFGGLSTNVLVLMPSIGASLEPPAAGNFMNNYMKKFKPLVYVSILILLTTGVIITLMMNPTYLSLSSEWAIVLLIKHVLIAFAVIATIYGFEVLAPKVAKLAAQGPSPELAQLQKVQMNSAKIGFIIALLILLLTGVQTAL
ncbi:MAG: hypothetical protein ACFFE2_17255 [Candidatus Thorarchaeota archaeon]